jgi:hypothetical protein
MIYPIIIYIQNNDLFLVQDYHFIIEVFDLS